MTALMEDSGLAQVFAVLRSQAMSLPDHERYAYLASLAVEEAGMQQAFATKQDADLWTPARQRRLKLVEAEAQAEAPEEAPKPSRVWDLTAPPPRFSPIRHAVSSIPGPRPEWAPAVAGSL